MSDRYGIFSPTAGNRPLAGQPSRVFLHSFLARMVYYLRCRRRLPAPLLLEIEIGKLLAVARQSRRLAPRQTRAAGSGGLS